jgi:stage V sporulation protein T
VKATGIVRRIDDLGRVVIPKEIRRTLRIREGDPLEIFTDREGEVILKKYSPIGELGDFAVEYVESLHQTVGHISCVADKDSIIAVAGGAKKEFLDKSISADLERIMEMKIQPFVLAKPGKGLRAFHYMTAFPAPVLQAQSWNIELVERIGHAIGREMLESGITFWLAPGLNIHRNPLCGRNFEYYSEDPLISGKMAAAVTRGVQSFEGIGVCLKHICCNNQEDRREYMTSDVHERALREIYLRGFSIAVKEAQPWSVMSSYNMVNSVYTPNSHDLLTKVLRNEWGFDGLVMTDWNSTEEDKGDHELCLPSGNDLIMPGSAVAKKAIKEGLKKGTITKEDLRRSAANILNLILESAVIKSDKNLQLCKKKKKKHTKTVEKSKI